MSEKRTHSPRASVADRSEDYEYKKRFYQNEEVADDYDLHRFASPRRQRRNDREWRVVSRALVSAVGVKSVLDMPCGTGRFMPRFAAAGFRVVGADIALPMMRVAKEKCVGLASVGGFVRADAERLPFADAALDCVVSIRFLHHVDPASRVAMLREMARVSRRWVLLDYRHKYSYRYAKLRLRSAVGFPARERMPQVSHGELDAETTAAGLEVVARHFVAPFFSDKWIVLCEKSIPS